MSWFRRKPQDDGLPQGSQHSQHSSKDDNDRQQQHQSNATLSPERPPPIHNVYQQYSESPSTTGPPPTLPPLSPSYHQSPSTRTSSTVSDLSKHRPIDPVFRSEQAYAAFPKMTMQQQTPNANVHVFDPSNMAGSATAQQQEPADDSPSEDSDQSSKEDEEEDQDLYVGNDTTSGHWNEHVAYENTAGVNLEDYACNIDEEQNQQVEVEGSVDDSYHRERPFRPPPFEDIDRPAEYNNDSEEEEVSAANADEDAMEAPFNSFPEPISTEEPGTANELEVRQPILETPANRRIKPSRFVFLSDQKSVPNDMKRLQEHTLKRRRDLLAKLHDVDCQMASVMAKFAEEKMDMELAISDTFERTVANPLASTIERLAIQREAASGMLAVTNLERRLNFLDAQMVHHLNVTLNDCKRDELESFHDDLQQDLVSEIQVETSKYDKVEGGIVRRFELVAGDIAKNFHKEGAARRAAMELLEQKISKTIPQQQTDRLDNTISKIAQLRAKLRQEKADRQAADQAILEGIVATTGAMKRAMIAIVSDGENQEG